MYRIALALALAAMVSGCESQLSNGLPDSWLGDGPPPQADAGDSWSGGEASPDTGPPPPPPPFSLPTFVALDWAAFPQDPGPSYSPTGRVWVVKKSGSDSGAGTAASPLKSIAVAVQQAASGDLIRVHAGTYDEGLPDEYRALVLEQDNLILTAAPGESVTVRPRTSAYDYGISIVGDNVVLNGINLDGFVYAIQIGREDSAQRNLVISNLEIQAPSGDFTEGIIAYEEPTAPGVATIDGLLLKNVSLYGMSMGVSCNAGPCRSWRLENVKVVGQGGSGSGADAIAVEDGDNFLFYKVDVSQVAADGIDTKATRVVVWDCHVHDLARNGVKLWHGGDIVNTRIHHTGADAAVVTEQGPRVRLLHSVVAFHTHNSSGYGMTFGYDSQAPQKVEIINSLVYNNSGAIYVNAASTVELRNTLFHSINNDELVQKGGTTIFLGDGPEAISNAGFGSGNIIDDPLAGSDLRLTSASPAINRGALISADYPEKDCEDKTRIKNGAADLGPFEDF